jgi:hypothetical protein
MTLLKLVALAALALVAGAAALGLALNARDRAQAARIWAALEAGRDPAPPAYDPAMVADLPEVARRYFAHAIAPGTPLHRTVRLEMAGSFILNGTELPMTARQILAPPGQGFVWQAEVGRGLMRFAGSDGYLADAESWTKFWLRGLVPLVRVGGGPDHPRSAATRAMMESIWSPAALLPQAGAEWVQTGPDTAEVRFPALPDVAPLEIVLNTAGDPVQARAMRWSDANPDKTYRLQPFGGRLMDWAEFEGFRIPVQVEMGNLFGTPDYAPFFLARVTAARYR